MKLPMNANGDYKVHDWAEIGFQGPIDDSKESVFNLIKGMIICDELEDLWRLPETVHAFAPSLVDESIRADSVLLSVLLPAGVDFVLVHRDKSITVINVKGDESDSTILAGVDELLRATEELRSMSTGWTIRLRLAAPTTGLRTVGLFHACYQRGVRYEPLGKMANYRRHIEALFPGLVQ